jgi:fatty-acyl-CoA synthase
VGERPLTPLAFLARSAEVWNDRIAVVDGDRTFTFGEHAERVRRLAGVLRSELGTEPGDRVAILLPNVSAAIELHYAVPGIGAVLVPMNTRLAAGDYAYMLDHAGANVLFAHESLADVVLEALEVVGRDRVRVVWVDASPEGEYEALLSGAEATGLAGPKDENELLSINYTSGTTGRPKGVMTTHRGAFLHSMGVIAEAQLSPRSSYLWTLPIFHCNGWAFIWACTAMGTAQVCLPAVDPAQIWPALLEGGVTHMCAAPTVVTIMLEAEEARACPRPVRLFIGGAPPSPALLERAAALNIAITHLYGLTETYGPIAVCAWNPDWDQLPGEEQARLRARQGVSTVVSEPLRVVDGDLRDVPRDGESMGEVMMRGNNVTAGYYRDPDATAAAFVGDWFRSGDLGVMHPDGYVELRDRAKDVVISGGENISTIEVEHAIVAHPGIGEAAVVGAPDERWGEALVAFVTTRDPSPPSDEELRLFLRSRLARFKTPRRFVVVDELPKTGTGKVQKFELRARLRR